MSYDHTTARVAFVGEITGRTEPIPAGKRLDKSLSSAGVTRAQCYITNLCKAFAPSSALGTYHKTKKTVEETDFFHRCEQSLINELQDLDANIIVPMGNWALWALTRNWDITKWRGSLLTDSRLPGKWIVPTISPAAVNKPGSPEEYSYLLDFDVHRIFNEELKLPDRLYHLEPSFTEAMDYQQQCLSSPDVAFDIEISRRSKMLTCYGLSLSPNEAMCIPFTSGTGDSYFSPDQEWQLLKGLQDVLEAPSVNVINQNMLAFDSQYMMRMYGMVANNIDDTMVAQNILYPGFPKSLGMLTSLYTMEPYYKDDGGDYGDARGNLRSFWRYNCKDCCVCHEMMPTMLANLEKMGMREVYNWQMRLHEPLLYILERGFRTDPAGIAHLEDELGAAIADKQKALNKLAGWEINVKSNPQCKKLFVEQLGLPQYKSRTTKKPGFDKMAMKRYVRQGCKEAKLAAGIREDRDVISKCLKMKFDKDNRLRSSMSAAGTKTGRLSSSQTIFGTGGNIQNLPYGFRKFLLADKDYVLYNVDLSAAEDRIVAYIAPEYAKQQAYEKGIDAHSNTAALLFNKPVEEISSEKGSSALGDGSKSERDWGKKSNHGLNYNLGYRNFSLDLEISEKEGKWIHNGYHRIYPGLKGYYDWIQKKLNKDRILTNLMGRKRRFWGRWGEPLFNEAYAFIPQSTVADIINRRGLIPIYEDQETYGPVELLNQGHDSLVFQIPLSVPWHQHAQILHTLNNSLTQPLVANGVEFRIPCDFSFGSSFGVLTDFSLALSVEPTAYVLETLWENKDE